MELSNYHLESQSRVRLFYKDGRQKLVTRADLAKHLTPPDAERVQNAFYLRQAYFRELPKWVKTLIISVLVLGLGFEGVKAAPGIQRVLHTIIPAIPAPTPAAPVPVPAPATSSAAPSTAPTPQVVVPEQKEPSEARGRLHSVVGSARRRAVRGPAFNVNANVRAIIHGPVRSLQSQAQE